MNKLKMTAGKDNVEAYFYSTDAKAVTGSPEAALVSLADKKVTIYRKHLLNFLIKGNVYLVDQASKSKFKIAKSLDNCLETVLKGHYNVNLQKGTITPENQGSSDAASLEIAFPQDAKEDFIQ